jgi:predicted transposase/invertase (TIGR01784 family)
MVFADLKNDFVFRRVFAGHPAILACLLNDLLERQGEQLIDSIEYLPPEQPPLVQGAKLSILDVKCRERSGATFIVEMQLLHMPGFLNRVVYNACKAFVSQLKVGEPYTKLADVVALSICDFALWPDADQDALRLPHVPMLSCWSMTEQRSGARDLLQVQYAFLELAKLPTRKPASGAELWAWLFVHTAAMTKVPEELPAGPYREAVELANEATFSLGELEAYRKVMDEIQQAREYGDAQRAEGFAEGRAEGRAEGETPGVVKGKVAAILAVLAARGLVVSVEARARIEACAEVPTLDRWIARAVTAASAEEVLLPAAPER